MKMKRVPNFIRETYQYGKYIIEISSTYETYDAYICDPKYGVKSYMFGVPVEHTSFDEFVALVKANAEEYAKIYTKAYGDEAEHDADVDAMDVYASLVEVIKNNGIWECEDDDANMFPSVTSMNNSFPNIVLMGADGSSVVITVMDVA